MRSDRASIVILMSTLTACGPSWELKRSTGPTGPGDCVFSTANVERGVGEFRLRLGEDDTCAEARTALPRGPVRITARLSGPFDAVPAHAVLGFFVYRSDESEFDVEFTRWGQPEDASNAQFVVVPAREDRIRRFKVTGEHVRIVIEWRASSIRFALTDASRTFRWEVSDRIPDLDQQHWLHVNYWVTSGAKHPRRAPSFVLRQLRIEPLH